MGQCLACLREPSDPSGTSSKLGGNISSTLGTDCPSNGTTSLRRLCGGRRTSGMGATESRPGDARINALFDIYRDPNEDCILTDGIEQFCRDLQVPPDDFRILVMAWRMGAAEMCRFSRTEFITGLRAIRSDSIRTIQARLPDVAAEVVRNAEHFKELYRFTFKFGLDAAAGERILPTDMAILLWRLVFTPRPPPILERWLNFLECHPTVRGIPRDTWNMFLNFSDAVGDDLSSYDDNEAWPTLFDDFVEYENDQANQNIPKDGLLAIKSTD